MRKVMFVSVVVVGAGQVGAQPMPPVDDAGTSTAELDATLAPPSAAAVQRPTPVHVKPRDPLATTERWGGGVRLTGLSGIGALPGVNFGGEVALGLRHDEMFGELALGRWVPENDYYVAETGTLRPLRLDVWTVRAGWSSMHMPLRAWALAEVGELASLPGMQSMPGVVTRMVMGETPSARSWKALGAGLGVAWPMSDQARLVGNMEVAVPTSTDQLAVNGYGQYQPDVLAARFSAGLEVGWR